MGRYYSGYRSSAEILLRIQENWGDCSQDTEVMGRYYSGKRNTEEIFLRIQKQRGHITQDRGVIKMLLRLQEKWAYIS